MQNGYAVARLIVCYTVCFFFLIYSFFGSLNIKHKPKPTFTDNFSKSQENIEKSEVSSQSSTVSDTQTAKTEESEKQEATQSVAASVEAVKGKVITRYISPYNAPLSFNGVYVKNSSGADINLKSLLNKDLGLKIAKNDQPQVLIMHTHTTETYLTEDKDYYTENFKSRTTDNSKNMAKIGSIIAKKLNENGIKTIHDTTKHDYPEYTGSYSRAAKTVTSYLKKYPSIKVVLDLHRDAVSTDGGKAKLVTEINGKKAAQVMLVMGSQTGSITGHPNWQENLSLAVKLQQTMEQKYPTLARPILLMSKKYNQSLSKGSLLIEFGTDVNTLEEASYSAELVAESLISLFNKMK